MSTSLVEPPLFPHLVIRALEQHGERPCLHIGGEVHTYADVRKRTSQLVQAQLSRGIGLGTRLAVLSKNRPEVVTNLTASLVNGCVITPLHPMGSLDDHEYAIADAEIDCLVFDAENFGDRAADLQRRFPSLILLGFGPSEVGEDYLAGLLYTSPSPRDH